MCFSTAIRQLYEVTKEAAYPYGKTEEELEAIAVAYENALTAGLSPDQIGEVMRQAYFDKLNRN